MYLLGKEYIELSCKIWVQSWVWVQSSSHLVWAEAIPCKQGLGQEGGRDFRVLGSSSGFWLDPEAKVSMKQVWQSEGDNMASFLLLLRNVCNSNFCITWNVTI